MPLDTASHYLTDRQVAARLGVSTATIWRWKRNGDFPQAVRLGPKMARWRLDDIIAFEASLQACFTLRMEPRMADVACPKGEA